MHRTGRTYRVLAALVLTVVLAGCRNLKEPTAIADLPVEFKVPAVEYVIQPGDEIDFFFRHTPELNVLLQVRPDGGLSLPILHDVDVAGKTVDALQKELTIAFSEELNDPDIAVILRSFAGHQIHIGGEVGVPGVYPMIRPTTVLEAVFAAGGFLETARFNEVVLLRRTESGYAVVPLELDKAIDGSDPGQNLALLPYDAVFVPRSHIANVNLWIDQYIRQNIPINFAVRPGDFAD